MFSLLIIVIFRSDFSPLLYHQGCEGSSLFPIISKLQIDDNGKIKKYIPKYWELCDDNKLHEQIENLKYDFAVTVVAMAKCVDAAMEIDQTPVYPRSRIPLSDGQPVIGISGKTLNEQSGYFKIYENKGVILYVIDVIDGENVTVDEYGNALYAPANYWSPVLSIPTLMCSDNQATSYE